MQVVTALYIMYWQCVLECGGAAEEIRNIIVTIDGHQRHRLERCVIVLAMTKSARHQAGTAILPAVLGNHTTGLFVEVQGTRLSAATTTSAWQGPSRFWASALRMLSPLTGNKPTFTFTFL